MTIWGVSIILILGIINFIIILIQILSGLHILKLKPGIHKATGITLFFTAALHGLFALLFR